jgi:hypothetical protein
MGGDTNEDIPALTEEPRRICVPGIVVIAASLVILISLSCAPRMAVSPSLPIEKERTYQYPFSPVWTKLIYLLNEEELPIAVIERESGVVVTDFVRFGFHSRFGTSVIKPGILESVREGRYTLNILVVAETESVTTVRINVHSEKLSEPLLTRGYDWAATGSTGYIEKDLLDKLEALLEGCRLDELSISAPAEERTAPVQVQPGKKPVRILLSLVVIGAISWALFSLL